MRGLIELAARKRLSTIAESNQFPSLTTNTNSDARTQQWLDDAKKSTTELGKRLTLITDLDETVFMLKDRFIQANSPEKFSSDEKNPIEITFKNGTSILLFVDTNAFAQLRAFQERGHNIAVVTAATYQFDEIAKIFKKFGVILEKRNFHNRIDIEAAGFTAFEKATYIDSLPRHITENALLVDDAKHNEPKDACRFLHLKTDSPYPTLSAPALPTLTRSRHRLFYEIHNQNEQAIQLKKLDSILSFALQNDLINSDEYLSLSKAGLLSIKAAYRKFFDTASLIGIKSKIKECRSAYLQLYADMDFEVRYENLSKTSIKHSEMAKRNIIELALKARIEKYLEIIKLMRNTFPELSENTAQKNEHALRKSTNTPVTLM